MFLELLNDLFVNSSIFYFYFGFILTAIGVSQFVRLNHYALHSRYEFSLHERKAIKIDIEYIEKPMIRNESIIVWFVKTSKRIDKPDDKEDDSASYFNKKLKIRGGQLWKETAYSLSLKNIVYSSY